jgi:hypothetical protein
MSDYCKHNLPPENCVYCHDNADFQMARILREQLADRGRYLRPRLRPTPPKEAGKP